jgi:hypothetical protein
MMGTLAKLLSTYPGKRRRRRVVFAQLYEVDKSTNRVDHLSPGKRADEAFPGERLQVHCPPTPSFAQQFVNCLKRMDFRRVYESWRRERPVSLAEARLHGGLVIDSKSDG